MIAYMIRVMLSHVRIKAAAARKNGMDGHPPELQELYAKMNEFKLEGPPSKMPKGQSSSQPSSSRPNPFVRFQAAEESEKFDFVETTLLPVGGGVQPEKYYPRKWKSQLSGLFQRFRELPSKAIAFY